MKIFFLKFLIKYTQSYSRLKLPKINFLTVLGGVPKLLLPTWLDFELLHKKCGKLLQDGHTKMTETISLICTRIWRRI